MEQNDQYLVNYMFTFTYNIIFVYNINIVADTLLFKNKKISKWNLIL